MSISNEQAQVLITELKKFPVKIISISLCGSTVAKLNISTSDIDVIVIAEPLDSIHEFNKSHNFEKIIHQSIVIENKRFDFMFIDKYYYMKLLDEVILKGSLSDNRVCIDKFIVTEVIYGHEKYNRLRKSFNIEEFKKSFIENSHSRFLNMYEDFKGAVKENDIELSIIWGRLMLVESVEAFLCINGDYYSRRKWQYKRFQKIERFFYLLENYKLFLFKDAPINEKELKEWCVNILKFCFILSISAVSLDYPEKIIDFFNKNEINHNIVFVKMRDLNILIYGDHQYEFKEKTSIDELLSSIKKVSLQYL